jgi:stage 0 sporulation regulatory protein
MSKLQEISKTIAELRAKLNKIAEGKNMTDPEVVAASQMLDAVLNEYQKLMKDKATRS